MITAGVSRVASGLLCVHAIAITPAGPIELVRSSLSIVNGLPCVTVRSAPAIVVSGPAQRSLTLWPARSPSRLATPLHRKLRQLRCLCRRFDCYRVERTSSRAGVAPAEVHRLSRRTVTYNKVFPNSISVGHIFAIQTLGRAYDRVKQELKTKSDAGTITDIEERQLRLLNYPASKQFVMSVVGELREEIAGGRISEPRAFELNPEFITADGKVAVEPWVKVLRSLLPIMVQNLPAEEYEVVRSTEHTRAVAKSTKGVVAA
jgi:hypothetical protein